MYPCLFLPEWLDDPFTIAHRSIVILSEEADAHCLVHHMKDVDVGVIKHSAHLVNAELAHLQQLSGTSTRVKIQ